MDKQVGGNGLDRVAVLCALAVCIVFTVLNFSRMPQQILGTLPYLTCDEASVVRAADTVVQGGYGGFRCHETFIVSCYGGTQTFLDALTVWLVPEKLMETGRLAKQPGKRWQWLAENSIEVSLLRFSRLLYAAFALIFFFWAGGGLPLPSRLLLTFALGSSWSFVEAWLGVKNDYPSLFFLLLFVFFLWKFSRLPGEKQTIGKFLPVFILGNLGIWVRIPMVVPVFLAAILYLTNHFQDKWTVKLAIRDSLVLLFTTLGVFLFLHPNIFHSSMEMHWMDPTIFIGRAPSISWGERAAELRLVAFSSWPLFFVAVPLFQLARARKFSSQDRVLYYFFLTALALEALMFQKNQGRSHYYLAGTGVSFFLLQRCWISGPRPTKRVLVIFSAIALLTTLYSHLFLHRVHTRGFVMDTGPTASMSEEHKLTAFLNDPAQIGTEIAVDTLLRPVVYEASAESRKIIYFDSLSESPGELRKRVGPKAKIVTTCWSAKSDPLSDEIYSPSGEKWKAFLQGRCTEYQPIEERVVKAFMSYVKTTKFVIFDSDVLPERESAQALVRSALSPRMLKGAQFGDDTFDTLLRLEGAQSLTGNFVSSIKAHVLELSFDSACKKEGGVALHLEVDGKVHQASVSSDVSHEFCNSYGKNLCAWPWFRGWSQRRYSKSISLTDIAIQPQSKVKLRLDRLDSTESGCPVLLKLIRFH